MIPLEAHTQHRFVVKVDRLLASLLSSLDIYIIKLASMCRVLALLPNTILDILKACLDFAGPLFAWRKSGRLAIQVGRGLGILFNASYF